MSTHLAIIDRDLLMDLLSAAPKNPESKEIAHTERDIKTVLSSGTSPRTKLDRYNELLAVKDVHSQRRSDAQRSQLVDSSVASSPVGQFDRKLDELTELQRVRAQQMIKHLSKSNKITWDESGRVTINGDTIPGSNIADLVVKVSRNKTKTEGDYAGQDEFISLLKQTNTPMAWVENKSARQRLLSRKRHLSASQATPSDRTTWKKLRN